MRSYILADAETFVLEDIPIPQIEKTEVLIRVTLCGTCHPENATGMRRLALLRLSGVKCMILSAVIA